MLPLADYDSGHSFYSNSTVSSVRLDLKSNSLRVYDGWWDIINMSLLLLIVFSFLSGLSTALIIQNDWVVEILPHLKKTDLGIAMLGVSFSAGAAICLWLINNGTQRWSTMRRIYHFHRSFILLICSERGADLQKVMTSYVSLSESHFTNLSSCPPLAQEAFEQLRVICFSQFSIDESPELRSDFLVRLFIICLACRGHLNGLKINEEFLQRILLRASTFSRQTYRVRTKRI